MAEGGSEKKGRGGGEGRRGRKGSEGNRREEGGEREEREEGGGNRKVSITFSVSDHCYSCMSIYCLTLMKFL